MLETIRTMTRYEARSFLQSAFDCAVPAELLAYADTLPDPVIEVEPDPTIAERRARIWNNIRSIWRKEHRWDTHSEQVRLRRLGLKGANARWKEKRRRTGRLLNELAALKDTAGDMGRSAAE